MVSLGFITLDSNDNIQVVRGSVWLVLTVVNKAYLREYNMVGARFCIKTLSKDATRFKSTLRTYLTEHAFYSLDEYYQLSS
jgi:hypothetical protein